MNNISDFIETKAYIEFDKNLTQLFNDIQEYVPLTASVSRRLNNLKLDLVNLPKRIDIELLKKNFKETGECDHRYKVDVYAGEDLHNSYYDIKCMICGKIIKKDIKG